MKVIKNLIFIASFVLVYLIIKEFLSLYFYIRSINHHLAYVFLGLIFIVVIYFIIRPIFLIFIMNRFDGPVKHEKDVPLLIKKRIDNFKNNSNLQKSGFNVYSLEYNEESYNNAVKVLKTKCHEIRKKYVRKLFVSTAIAQNGFLDVILIISASINIIKDTFKLYKGRVNNRHLFIIFKQIYYSMAIGGSELPEYATEEVLSKFSSSAIKSIPFFKEIASSLVDGFVNASLLTRVSLIAENYCTLLLMKSNKDLSPKMAVIISTSKSLTEDITDKIFKQLKEKAVGKLKHTVDFMVSPVSKLMKTATSKENIVSSTYSNIISIFSKSKKSSKSEDVEELAGIEIKGK